jgi:hypothetical protein
MGPEFYTWHSARQTLTTQIFSSLTFNGVRSREDNFISGNAKWTNRSALNFKFIFAAQNISVGRWRHWADFYIVYTQQIFIYRQTQRKMEKMFC